MSSNPTAKAPRVLACVLCQHRKIKCDRNSPCSNCIKANVTCTPSTPAPARKRRRPNQDLQQRLARCEELLQEYATAKPPSASTEPSSSDETWKSLGKLIIDDSGVRFMDSFLWATVHDEVRAMREIVEEEDKEEDSYSTPTSGQTPDHHTGLLFSDTPDASNLSDMHPEPAHVFRLWQTFLERVNPLTKVIHVPSVQPLVVEAATNQGNLPKNVEALLFSIYTAAVVALSESECVAILGMSKDAAFNRFSRGARVAMMRIGILHKYDLVVLQALVLYLSSISGRYDRHAAWILNGVIIRIAQKMGLHRDGELLGLPPFETEMRRRVWWQIMLRDAVFALMSGLGQSMLPRTWDTKEPRNVNDADLFPAMTKVESRDSPTDMVFCLISYEIAKLLIDQPSLETVIFQNELGNADSPSSSEVEAARRRIDELDFSLSEILRKYGDPSMGPLHELAADQRPMMVNKLREVICPLREQPEWGTEIRTPQDNLFKIAVTSGEHALESYSHTEKNGVFLWFVMTHFQIDVFLFMVGQLCTRTSGQLVDRAWVVVENIFRYHTELFKFSFKPHASLAIFTLRAWKKRREVLQATAGSPPETPWYIFRLRDLLRASEVSQAASDDEEVDTPAMSVPSTGEVSTGVDMPWEQMMGLLDTGSFNWDMFGEPGQQPLPFVQYGTTYQNANGWM